MKDRAARVGAESSNHQPGSNCGVPIAPHIRNLNQPATLVRTARNACQALSFKSTALG